MSTVTTKNVYGPAHSHVQGGYDLTNPEYHGSGRFGSSSLGSILKNAKKWRLEKDGTIETNTKAFDIGTVLHTLVLEPHTANDVFRIGQPLNEELLEIVEKNELDNLEVWTDTKSKTAKKYQDAQAATTKVLVLPDEYDAIVEYLKNPNLIVIKQDDFDNAQRMANNILELEGFDKYLANGHAEVSFIGEIDGLPVQCRTDLIITQGNRALVIDVKSTGKEATTEGFSKSSSDFLYFLQEALYREVLFQNGYEEVKFIFAVGSKIEWSGAGFFEHDKAAVEIGYELLEKAVQKANYCISNELWLEDDFDFAENAFKNINQTSIGPWMKNKFG